MQQGSSIFLFFVDGGVFFCLFCFLVGGCLFSFFGVFFWFFFTFVCLFGQID